MPLTDLANGLGDSTLGPLGRLVTGTGQYPNDKIIMDGSVDPANPPGQKTTTQNRSRYVDDHVNMFVKGVQNNAGLANDPTFLGFSILIDWHDSPLLLGGLTGQGNKHTNPQQLAAGEDGTFPEGSALWYLNQTGETARSRYLQSFIQQLNYLNKNMPWYWQTIEGLDQAWKQYHLFHKEEGGDIFRGGPDAVIKIGTLESVDFRLQGLIDLYQKACYDFAHRRTIIPYNLRLFDVYIFVEEIRRFQTIQKAADQADAASRAAQTNNIARTEGVDKSSKDLAELLKTNTSKVVFRFKECQFLPEDSIDFFANVANAGAEMAKNSLAFEYKEIEITTNAPWFNFEIKDNPQQGNIEHFVDDKSLQERLQNAGDAFKRRLENAAKRIKRGAINDVANLGRSQLTRLITENLGVENVYGKGTRVIDALTRGSIDGVIRDIKTENQAKKDLAAIQASTAGSSENVFPPSAGGQGSLGSENIYPDTPPQQGDLGEQNVYE